MTSGIQAKQHFSAETIGATYTWPAGRNKRLTYKKNEHNNLWMLYEKTIGENNKAVEKRWRAFPSNLFYLNIARPIEQRIQKCMTYPAAQVTKDYGTTASIRFIHPVTKTKRIFMKPPSLVLFSFPSTRQKVADAFLAPLRSCVRLWTDRMPRKNILAWGLLLFIPALLLAMATLLAGMIALIGTCIQPRPSHLGIHFRAKIDPTDFLHLHKLGINDEMANAQEIAQDLHRTIGTTHSLFITPLISHSFGNEEPVWARGIHAKQRPLSKLERFYRLIPLTFFQQTVLPVDGLPNLILGLELPPEKRMKLLETLKWVKNFELYVSKDLDQVELVIG